MSEVLLHFTIPFIILVPIIGTKRALIFSLLALTPDIDALFYIHRSITHSIPFLITLTLPPMLVFYKLGGNLWKEILILTLAILIHPILDLFQGYTPLFYPLINESIYIKIDGKVIIGESIKPALIVVLMTKPTEFTRFEYLNATLFSSQGLIMSVIIIGVTLIVKFREMLRRNNFRV